MYTHIFVYYGVRVVKIKHVSYSVAHFNAMRFVVFVFFLYF